ncbi:MAG: DNA translocase FtsK [Flavobacteriaceae bacterium]|nr:DNA translocase FtsK [Flavobacteriaceae bacterium]
MAKTKKKKTTSKRSWKLPKMTWTKKHRIILGVFLMFIGLALFVSFFSFLFTWKSDQSLVGEFFNRELEAKNWMSKFGAQVSHTFIYKGFGIGAFNFAFLILITGLYLFLSLSLKKLLNYWFWGLYIIILVSLFFGFAVNSLPILGGTVGFEINEFLNHYIGKIGVGILLGFLFIFYVVVRHNWTPDRISSYFKMKKKTLEEEFSTAKEQSLASENISHEINKEEEKISDADSNEDNETSSTHHLDLTEETTKEEKPKEKLVIASDEEGDVKMEVQTANEEDQVDELSKKLVEDFGEFDPTLELSNYQFPKIDLLEDYNKGKGITIDQNELEANKVKIVDTLKNYKIGIADIKATIGPTVTLYEIIPEAGIRISKIKNLEDDIALSLAALGIRIIAPIPGRGTIGIEVPNQNPSIVPMRSVVASPKFQQAEMQLPIALGKTISNETFVVDLAKMPHLLMAGATGQGKSVGLNVILTSLLYQKHPAEVKFVLVDPKKVELTLFNKIERHYLAKMPDVEDAIITDNSKVINTVNSLCIEMDARYDLLKDAMVRNIKEYNQKFKARKLNPEDGHKFLPYIVLVIDEFADLIMTAGKEIETPIARLAQLARAIGIHLIIATQRPSVNVITGMIKANFPARIAFRVTSKIDSRTILDAGGANQLIGRGDMLFTQGNDLVRLQCALVDTPEVDRITEFIGSQKAYPDAHMLPEYQGEESGTSLDDNVDERDSRFKEAAEIIVTAQQGSASLLQRKMKLGYNRAGRIIDQLEAAGIVGPFEGSKARQVLINDLTSLDEHLNNV